MAYAPSITVHSTYAMFRRGLYNAQDARLSIKCTVCNGMVLMGLTKKSATGNVPHLRMSFNFTDLSIPFHFIYCKSIIFRKQGTFPT